MDVFQSYTSHQCQADILDEVTKSKYKAISLKRSLSTIAGSLGATSMIQNEIFKHMDSGSFGASLPASIQRQINRNNCPPPSIQQYRDLQQRLVDRIHGDLQKLSEDLGVPFSFPVEQPQTKKRRQQFDDITFRHTFEVSEDFEMAFMYTPQDLLTLSLELTSTNLAAPQGRVGAMKAMLSGDVSPQAILAAWPEIAAAEKHFGVDDAWDMGFYQETYRRGETLIDGYTAPLLTSVRKYAKHGIPAGLRRTMWATLLGANIPRARGDFNRLRTGMRTTQLLVDAFTAPDIELHGLDEHFFVFESEMYELFACFIRDASVSRQAALTPPLPTGVASEAEVAVPCGVYPVAGFVRLIAPFCLLFSDQAEAYGLFRAMYCRYFCGLVTVAPGRLGLPYLLSAVETMVHTTNPRIAPHLTQLGLTVLDLVHPWLVFGFAGFLSPVEWACLWDRVLAQDSLLPLALLAAGIIELRADAMLTLSSANDVRDLFSDFTAIKAIAVIQSFVNQSIH
ncbi:hypothetical protein J8273_7269 [Carpediemonas membranifera]|uniref:Rab-GAP TBC domain-containing protein n=1 Tax=Carpediemonas membranifera TaxID=201153 RepID=A0A8J6AS75_9EUKA|nr:hypothetical protein J8273_7269 [Carpediemonas membranifera]|eukprot:KAG9390995.1 hypothetical protein J8273_7269 [Carpediemonas membranifera]